MVKIFQNLLLNTVDTTSQSILVTKDEILSEGSPLEIYLEPRTLLQV